MSEPALFDVAYRCHACDATFTLRQHDPRADEDITYCWPCLDVIFSSDLGGTREKPWTRELIRQARGLEG